MIQDTCFKVMKMHSSLYKNFSSKQKFLFLFGAPGVGKGTYAKLLAKDLKFNHISTGDEIRKILKGKASAGFDKNLIEQIKTIVNSGKLVSDDIVVNIIKEKIKEPESKNGVILDGFPRTVSQLQKYDAIGLPTHLVVNLTLNQSILLEKLTARRHCNECGQSFNICNIQRDGYQMDPLLPSGACVQKKCIDKLQTRDDDKAEVIKARMVEYDEQTLPLLSVYQQQGVTFDFEAKKGFNDYARFLSELKPKVDAI